MLKQTANETRTLFIKLFTQELIVNSKSKTEEIKAEGINIEKPQIAETEKKVEKISEMIKPIEREKFIPSIPKFEPRRTSPVIAPAPTKPYVLSKPAGPLRPVTKPLEAQKQPPALPSADSSRFTMPISTLPKIEGEISLGKLNIFLSDNAVTEIECPGPDKFILVKKIGQINLTKITLSQEEINEIIKSFSENARIPVISGIFKTSVKNLTLTAIISEFVGSRFILYKSTPYSLLEQKNRQRLMYGRRML